MLLSFWCKHVFIIFSPFHLLLAGAKIICHDRRGTSGKLLLTLLCGISRRCEIQWSRLYFVAVQCLACVSWQPFTAQRYKLAMQWALQHFASWPWCGSSQCSSARLPNAILVYCEAFERKKALNGDLSKAPILRWHSRTFSILLTNTDAVIFQSGCVLFLGKWVLAQYIDNPFQFLWRAMPWSCVALLKFILEIEVLSYEYEIWKQICSNLWSVRKQ